MANPEIANDELSTVKGDAAQEHILIEVARRLFHERGYGKVKLSDIAKAAGLTQKETQLYFSSPQDICVSVIESHSQSQNALFEDINQNTNPRQRLSLYLDSVIENTDILIARGCPMTNLYFDVKREDRNLASEAAELLKQRLEWIRAQFVEIMRVENNTDLPERLTGAIHGIAILAQVTGNPDLIRNQVNQLKSWIRSM
ncbi:MAG TPA: TetR/AcrR family transcriptional regulator [Sphingomonadales bacterium]|nr:TetR/AcrR family transcriptional regulator [Sphingomonadales bacterium]